MKPVLLNNRYKLVELVGSGGMAIVYRGEDTLLKRPVAVKVLREPYSDDPAFLKRFRREAQAAAALDHANVVRVYDVGEDEGRHYIVMEYVDGQDLKTLIRRRNRMTVEEALSIATQISAGVGHAHQAGVIHCDIKPQNVLVTEDGKAKVADFGIARALSESGLTDPETVWGSPLYYSPEQAAGESPTPASDVYSIGITLYEMLSGSPPFRAEKPTALALMHMRGDPPPLAARCPQVPPQLEAIVRKALAKEPGERYATAGEFSRVLADYMKRGLEATGVQPVVRVGRQAAKERVATGRKPGSGSGQPMASNGLTYLLGVVAAIAVIGLAPMTAWVLREYSNQPTPTEPGPPGTPTPTPVLVTVPEVVGQLVGEAREELEALDLMLVEGGKQENSGQPGGTVLSQDPSPGVTVEVGSNVMVVIASGGTRLQMVNLLGYSDEEARDYLEGYGLHVVLEEIWSPEKEGNVVGQIPGSGATIFAGDTITLSVSGGFEAPIPLEVNLDNKITLYNAFLSNNEYQPGDTVRVRLQWGAQEWLDAEYTVYVHMFIVVNDVETYVAQHDGPPLTSPKSWVPGERYSDTHSITIPSTAEAGTYIFRVGMYPPGDPYNRLPVVDTGRTSAENNSILVAEISVVP